MLHPRVLLVQRSTNCPFAALLCSALPPWGWATAGPQAHPAHPRAGARGQPALKSLCNGKQVGSIPQPYQEPDSGLFSFVQLYPRAHNPAGCYRCAPRCLCTPTCLGKAVWACHALQLRSQGVRAPCPGSSQLSAGGDGWGGQAGAGGGSAASRLRRWMPQGLQKFPAGGLPLPLGAAHLCRASAKAMAPWAPARGDLPRGGFAGLLPKLKGALQTMVAAGEWGPQPSRVPWGSRKGLTPSEA